MCSPLLMASLRMSVGLDSWPISFSLQLPATDRPRPPQNPPTSEMVVEVMAAARLIATRAEEGKAIARKMGNVMVPPQVPAERSSVIHASAASSSSAATSDTFINPQADVLKLAGEERASSSIDSLRPTPRVPAPADVKQENHPQAATRTKDDDTVRTAPSTARAAATRSIDSRRPTPRVPAAAGAKRENHPQAATRTKDDGTVRMAPSTATANRKGVANRTGVAVAKDEEPDGMHETTRASAACEGSSSCGRRMSSGDGKETPKRGGGKGRGGAVHFILFKRPLAQTQHVAGQGAGATRLGAVRRGEHVGAAVKEH